MKRTGEASQSQPHQEYKSTHNQEIGLDGKVDNLV